MPRVIGIDPGTVSIDLCGLDDGRVFLDRTMPTAEALADPGAFVALLTDAGPLDLIAGPSGYGLPLTRVQDVTDADLRLAYLAPEGEAGGIGGLRSLMRALARSGLPVVLTPGVIHLPTVPAHRKANRVDMGTADKVCAAALALHQHRRLPERLDGVPSSRGDNLRGSSFILIELGGAFTAAVAVDRGAIVDGLGGTSGPIGGRASGALDGEVAFLAGSVSKDMLFRGGIDMLEEQDADAALIEGAARAAAMLAVSVPDADAVLLSGRRAHEPGVADELHRLLSRAGLRMRVDVADGFARVAKAGAQGAALVADGLAGGASRPLVESLAIREASGTVLDHLFVISADQARRRLGLA